MNGQIVNRKIKDLTDHPLNHIMYDKDKDNRDKLRKSLLKSFKKYGYSNKEFAFIDRNDVLYSGHRRKWASEEDDTKTLKELRCMVIDHVFDPKSLNDPALYQIELDLLDEYNEPDVIRNQTKWSVILKKYDVFEKNHINLTGKEFTGKERNEFCRVKSSHDKDHFKKMVEVYKMGRHDLVEKVDTDDLTVGQANTLALKIQPKTRLKENPNRKNWVNYFFNNKSARKRVVKYANDMFNQHLDIEINGIKIPEHPIHGHEPNMLSTCLSNFYMSALSLVLKEELFKPRTARHEPGIAVLIIEDLCRKGCHPESIEVKVASFDGHGSKTMIHAGGGAYRIHKQTFLIAIYDKNTKRQMVVLSDLEGSDWTMDSANKKGTLGMNIWADNYLDECVFFIGDGFVDSNKVFQMILGNPNE